MRRKGHLVISLDFELAWGIFDVVDVETKKAYFENTRNVIPEILKAFEAYNIRATWAVVGMLFNENWSDWKINIPASVPKYKKKELSPYDFGRTLMDKDREKFVFANELIEQIAASGGQEIGTHTYSHYYCLEEGQTAENFKDDLERALELARRSGIDIESLVFPRNQVREDYLKICADMGIKSVRTNPDTWYWKDTLTESLIPKLARSGDAYLSLGKKTYSLERLKIRRNLPVEQPASRFLRPSENSLMNSFKINRIRKEMTRAAKNGEVYHLWWHPHNFGDNPQKSISDLADILEHFKKCQSKYGFSSSNMGDITKEVQEKD